MNCAATNIRLVSQVKKGVQTWAVFYDQATRPVQTQWTRWENEAKAWGRNIQIGGYSTEGREYHQIGTF